MVIFDLKPSAALHVGEFVGIERESVLAHIPSDTLFAAMVTAWQRRGADLTARLQACQATPPAVWLSSAFPRAGSVRFYPMPMGIRLNFGNQNALEGKTLKRIQWVSADIFGRLTRFEDVSAERDLATNFLQHKSVWLSRAERTRLQSEFKGLFVVGQETSLWDIQIVPRVAVDRATQASNLFHSGRLVFAKGCGLWFMAQGIHTDWVSQALDELQDSGLGGLRSVGHGAFVYTSVTQADVVLPANMAYAISLSRYAPNGAAEVGAAVQARGSAYRLVQVGGWCQDDAGKTWRRKSVRMLAEGACVGATAAGHIVNVMPNGVMDRPVLRYGLAFKVPVAAQAMLVH